MNLGQAFRRCGVAVAVTAAVLTLSSGLARAHAEVVSTDPADGSVLTKAPTRITLTFSEEVDVALASVGLTAASGEQIDLPAIGVGSNASQLVVAVPPLPDDAYRLSYDVRDPVDLHETAGSIVFGVGTVPTMHGGESRRGVALGDSLFEWAARGGLALVVGGIGMTVLVRRRWRSLVDPESLVTTSMGVLRFGACVIFVGELGAFVRQVVDIRGARLDIVRRLLLDSSYGQRFIVTSIVVAGLLRFVHVARPLLLGRPTARAGVGEVGIVIAGGWLVAIAAWSAHAGVGGARATGIALRAGHLAGMGVWVGGLVVLVVVRGRVGTAAFRSLARSFSAVALTSVTLTVATGLLLSGREVRSLTALFSTAFGAVLLVKVGLVLVAMALGARHGAAVRAGRKLAWASVTAEAAIALLVVLAAAGLATTPPAVGERFEPAPDAASTTAATKVGDLLVRLTIGPSRPGRNLVRVELVDSRRPPPPPAESVTLRLTTASGDVATLTGGPPNGGVVELEPIDVVAPGPVRVTISVERVGRPVPPASFDWAIGPTLVAHAPTVMSDRSLAPAATVAALLALGLFAVACFHLCRAHTSSGSQTAQRDPKLPRPVSGIRGT